MADVQPLIDDCKIQLAEIAALTADDPSPVDDKGKGKGKQRVLDSDSEEEGAKSQDRPLTDAERLASQRRTALSLRVRELVSIKHRACFFL